MEPISETTPTEYKQVTVDVPAERLAEFHAFFARFLARSGRPGRRGEHRRHGHGHGHGHGRGHGRGCRSERAERSEAYERPAEAAGQRPETTEV